MGGSKRGFQDLDSALPYLHEAIMSNTRASKQSGPQNSLKAGGQCCLSLTGDIEDMLRLPRLAQV
jgi:hypothetical protein